MKNFTLTLIALCACFMVACGNAEVNEINQLVEEATEMTMEATSAMEVGQIAADLQAEMDRITAESGDKVTFGKSVEEALVAYQEAVAVKLQEFGVEME